MTKKHSNLLILSIVALIVWAGISAAEADNEQTKIEKPPVTEVAEPVAQVLGSPVQGLDLPVLDLESSQRAAAGGCTTQACGNTGTRWGVGPGGTPDCVNARVDLDNKLWTAATNICPGVVTGITRNYDNNCQYAGNGNCKESGDADVECKICPGQFCF